jgi:hypothetical protein
LRNNSNTYGLAVDGAIATGGTPTNLRIHGVLGTLSATQAPIAVLGPHYTQFDPAHPSYSLTYEYLDPATGQWVTVAETAKTQLTAGWNLLTRNITIDGITSTRTLLVYGDNTPPTVKIDPTMPMTIYRGNWNDGAYWEVWGTITDDSFGTAPFSEVFQLGNPTYFPGGIQTDSQGDYVVFEQTVQDAAGNQTLLTLTLRITDTPPPVAPPVSPPTYIPSATLIALLDPSLFKKS